MGTIIYIKVFNAGSYVGTFSIDNTILVNLTFQPPYTYQNTIDPIFTSQAVTPTNAQIQTWTTFIPPPPGPTPTVEPIKLGLIWTNIKFKDGTTSFATVDSTSIIPFQTNGLVILSQAVPNTSQTAFGDQTQAVITYAQAHGGYGSASTFTTTTVTIQAANGTQKTFTVKLTDWNAWRVISPHDTVTVVTQTNNTNQTSAANTTADIDSFLAANSSSVWNPTSTDITVTSWFIGANDTLGTSQTINATYQTVNNLAIGNQMVIGATINSGALIKSNPATISASNNISMVISGIAAGTYTIVLRLYDNASGKIISQSYNTTFTVNTPPTATNQSINVTAPDGTQSSFVLITSELALLTTWANQQTQGSLITISAPVLTSNNVNATASTVETWINSHLRIVNTGANFQLVIQTSCGQYSIYPLTTDTTYTSLFPNLVAGANAAFPAKTFVQTVLNGTYPNVPNTLNCLIGQTNITISSSTMASAITTAANNIVACYGSTPTPPKSTRNWLQLAGVAFAGLLTLSLLTGGSSKKGKKHA